MSKDSTIKQYGTIKRLLESKNLLASSIKFTGAGETFMLPISDVSVGESDFSKHEKHLEIRGIVSSKVPGVDTYKMYSLVTMFQEQFEEQDSGYFEQIDEPYLMINFSVVTNAEVQRKEIKLGDFHLTLLTFTDLYDQTISLLLGDTNQSKWLLKLTAIDKRVYKELLGLINVGVLGVFRGYEIVQGDQQLALITNDKVNSVNLTDDDVIWFEFNQSVMTLILDKAKNFKVTVDPSYESEGSRTFIEVEYAGGNVFKIGLQL
ncbi:hypothetical protein GPK34_00415 [Secundilactobacillus kimchicus]|uniref:hypothetical protein n=1 Tax=Secundilactobacillus kimchicus TaxID=528209 RepID=UPI001C01473F|nr:hypothetical protein [Secundilactobacillus kimchicus]MBT9670500.1 hypothetical protein [Secundilactobacillus kimchicus]